MNLSSFNAQIRRSDRSVIIDLQGEIDSQADQALNQAYTDAAGYDSEALMLNFSNVVYINSTGIALIVGILAQARKARKRLVVFGLSDHYMQIFKITRLSDFMDIYQDESSALKG